MSDVIVIGGGLAGCEASWFIANSGYDVDLYEMRPEKGTEAHKTDYLCELVCSNSFKSNILPSAPALLKEEMKFLGSLSVKAANETSIPAGSALAVDRVKFARTITEAIENHPKINLIRKEVENIPKTEAPVIIATGPLTSQPLAEAITKLVGDNQLYFYDAISPIVEKDSINMDIAYKASRYDKGGDDYINCPLTEEIYDNFIKKLLNADRFPPREFEKIKFYEGCIPIEELALRGRLTLAFGALKPVGLPDPRTGMEPFAVVQLRADNAAFDSYGMVGFQTQLLQREQTRVFSMIPGLENIKILRYGSLHRNTYINSPKLLTPMLKFRKNKNIIFAGQLIGVEGYLESAASGIIAGFSAVSTLRKTEPKTPPNTTLLGALLRYISSMTIDKLEPMNVNFGLLRPIDEKTNNKKKRRHLYCERSIADLTIWKNKWINF
ncbi:methylenetetrahydrofolate--tRNA-(uracil(54)-C(5))-methyltransferase (FADH(2)-oxidizing) TrmFO [bacterium]|nr:methylenetetrahydrofolate--tRNA-(uracil(54)-C(5))-methyltransferase (FADH(2)-oxidizing) TrmFO [bacterium]